jgi:large subunit ribosomal protein L35
MPKLKTNKSAKKRFKVTGTGKIKAMRLPGRKHLMKTKNSKRKRSLRQQPVMNKSDTWVIQSLLNCR